MELSQEGDKSLLRLSIFVQVRLFLLIEFKYIVRMGQNTSTDLGKAALLSNYHQLDLHSQFGTLVSHSLTKQTYLLKELNFPNFQDYKKALTHYEAKKANLQQNILNLIQLESQSKSLFCSEINRLSLIYEFSEITLAKQIEARQPELRYFEELDIWSILQSCCYGLMELKEKIILQTDRVYIMADGLVKVIDSDLITNNSWYMLDQNLYYSPERFENFDSSHKVNTTESDVMFSLGATLLHTATLESIFDCYEYGSHRFNQKRLKEKLEKLETLYSQDFTAVISGLLEIDPNDRITMKEVEAIVSKIASQDTQEFEEAPPAHKHQLSYQPSQQYRESAMESMRESVRESIPVLTKEQRNYQPFKQINNYHLNPSIPKYEEYQNQPLIPNPPSIKFKNIEIKTILEPIIEQNPTRQYTKFEPLHFSNYKEVEQSQFESVHPRPQHPPQYSAISNHVSFSPLGFEGRLESVRSKNVSQFNHSGYPEFNQCIPARTNPVRASNDENLFTDPKLMEQIRRDMNEITSRRSLMPTPHKPHHSEYSTYQCSSTYHHPPAVLPPPPIEKSNPKPKVHYEQDGKVFEGFIINGVKEGFGKLSYPEGPYYLGNFQNDKMHGMGVLYYDEGKPAYDGQWCQDQFQGKGTLFNQNPLYQNQAFDYTDFNLVEDYWTKYQGQFVADNKEGLGKLFLSNGEMFEGEFEKDCINGEGIFYSQYGEKCEGRWDNNILIQRFSSG